MINKLITTSIGIVPIVACFGQPVQKKLIRPNIVILLVDDLGWKDVGYMGSKYYESPNIDKLSRGGMVFTNAYAACAVSSPTRASLQTGRYPSRIGVTDWIRAR